MYINHILSVVGFALFAASLALMIIALIYDETFSKRARGLAYLAVVSFCLFIFGCSFVIIPTGYTGVKTTFGQIDPATLQNGANWKIPFIQSVERVNNKQQDILFEGQVWSETSERTALYYDGITVTYQINPEKSAWIYANVSSYKENLVTPSLVSSAIKESSKVLTSVDATNRGIIEPLAMENIQKALNEKYGEDVVFISKVTISGADFEDSYNQAIAEKQTAQLAYEKQQIENQKRIEAAEADAKVKSTQAQAEANAAVIKAQGEADANKLLNDSITNKTLAQEYLDKWDGALPKVSLSDDSDTIIDIGDVISTESLTAPATNE